MSKNDSNISQTEQMNSSNNLNLNNTESKEKPKEEEIKNENDNEVMIEVVDKKINTDELSTSELERLVKGNKDLTEVLNDDKGNNINNQNEIFNIDHEVF